MELMSLPLGINQSFLDKDELIVIYSGLFFCSGQIGFNFFEFFYVNHLIL